MHDAQDRKEEVAPRVTVTINQGRLIKRLLISPSKLESFVDHRATSSSYRVMCKPTLSWRSCESSRAMHIETPKRGGKLIGALSGSWRVDSLSLLPLRLRTWAGRRKGGRKRMSARCAGTLKIRPFYYMCRIDKRNPKDDRSEKHWDATSKVRCRGIVRCECRFREKHNLSLSLSAFKKNKVSREKAQNCLFSLALANA